MDVLAHSVSPIDLILKSGILLLLLLLLCHMPSGTRAKLPCEAKRSSKVNIIISIIIVMSVLSIN